MKEFAHWFVNDPEMIVWRLFIEVILPMYLGERLIMHAIKLQRKG